MPRLYTTTSVLLFLVCASLASTALGQVKKRPKAEPPAAQSTPKGPQPYSKVVEGIENVKAKRFTEDELIRFILANGVDFPSTKANLDQLRELGASERVIEAILKVAPAPPEPPKPQPTGSLSLRCAPAECEIKVNGKAAGSTVQGELSMAGLRLGEFVIDFAKPGYFAQQKTVQLTAESEPPIAVTLEPDPTTKAEFGKQLLRSMLQAEGARQGTKALRDLSGTGTANSWNAAGKQSEWEIAVAFSPPDLLKIDVKGADGLLTLMCRGEHCEPRKKGNPFGGGKQLKGEELEDLVSNLRQFARYHLAAMLDQFNVSTNRTFANTTAAGANGDRHFRVEATDVVYHVTLGPDLRIIVLDCDFKSGLGSGLKVTYGGYLKVGDIQYPVRTDIKLPGKPVHGIQVHLDHIASGGNLKEKDFPQ